MLPLSRSRLGHASRRLAFQDRLGHRWSGVSAGHSLFAIIGPGSIGRHFEPSGSRRTSLAVRQSSSAAPRESPHMVRPSQGRHASASFLSGADERRGRCGSRVAASRSVASPATTGASSSREPVRLPCLPSPAIRISATGRSIPSRRTPLHAPRRLAGPAPAVDPSSSPVRPLTNRVVHVQQQDAHRRRAPGRDPGRGAQR